ncbi:MAG: GTP-binding protein [Candidatus Nanoarchaeia archaeon]|nr:GTP-binding protein [Candidatus Nanoarchaeia archaeon]
MGRIDKLRELEEEVKTTKYNKRTQHAVGILKAQISRLKSEIDLDVTKKNSSGTNQGYYVKKTGDASIILIGFPSVGKSTLMSRITGTYSEAAAFAFTTKTIIPGSMKHKGANIQILDVPGIIQGASSGKGRGREVLAAARTCDFAMIIVDALRINEYDAILKELYNVNIRLNKRRSDLQLIKTQSGGINVQTTVELTKIDEELIKSILREYRYINADLLIREDIDVDDLIDFIEGNRKYMKSILVVNKIDLVTPEERKRIEKKLKSDISISASKDYNVEELKDLIIERLDLMRIYTKEINKKPDLEEPIVIMRNSKVRDVCLSLHRDFVDRFKYARVWGKSVKFKGQIVGIDHVLSDEDIIEIHINR